MKELCTKSEDDVLSRFFSAMIKKTKWMRKLFLFGWTCNSTG